MQTYGAQFLRQSSRRSFSDEQFRLPGKKLVNE
jgi:hypothetical protein